MQGSSAVEAAAGQAGSGRLARTGEWLRGHQRAIRRGQWGVVAVYLVLLVVPAALPLPGGAARLWSDFTLIAQFVFWGIWWPFVLLSVVALGRVWCDLFCPEGFLSELASRHGQRRATPRWLTWGGWPFVAFCTTTVYGQLVSVYQYPAPALLILGGSTAVAMLVGYRYGREKRVWCRYLCPVSGVFALLAKLAPLHYRVDESAWRSARKTGASFRRVNCAPLVPIATMKGGSPCHMCGRCSGFRDAVQLAARPPNREIVEIAGSTPRPWETWLILFGLLGVALAAFHWTSSETLVHVKLTLARWLLQHDVFWPLERSAPWWLLTNYPQHNDVLNLLDGALVIGFIGAVALGTGSALSVLLGVATRAAGPWSWPRFHHLTQALIPVAGGGVFLGLSALTVSTLRNQDLALWWIGELRAGILLGTAVWSLGLALAILRRHAPRASRSLLAALPMAVAVALAAGGWALLFWPL